MRNARFVLCLLAAACANGPVRIEQALDMCARGAPFAEVETSGKVVRVLGTSVSATGQHEGFILAANGMRIRVEDNVNITGPIPLREGEAVSLQGQYECNDGVIHYTHHDPRGRHISGYIEAGGKIYR